MRSIFFSIGFILLSQSPVFAQLDDKVADRLWDSSQIISEMMKAPDSEIPHELLTRAECVAVIPAAKKLALGFGGRYGRGVVSCRKDQGKGPWGPPSMLSLGGGSFGFQAGAQSIDVVMLFMTPESINVLLRDKVTLGGDAGVAVGPKGRNASAETSTSLKAEILSYSRSRGLFAGIALNGAVLKTDKEANSSLYGSSVTAADLLAQKKNIPIPESARKFVGTLTSASTAR